MDRSLKMSKVSPERMPELNQMALDIVKNKISSIVMQRVFYQIGLDIGMYEYLYVEHLIEAILQNPQIPPSWLEEHR